MGKTVSFDYLLRIVENCYIVVFYQCGYFMYRWNVSYGCMYDKKPFC